MSKKKYNLLLLSDEDKSRLHNYVNEIIESIEEKTKSLPEQAFILRILMESFEESKKCIVPFYNRYKDPAYIYQEKEGE
jgi:hypothetical protein